MASANNLGYIVQTKGAQVLDSLQSIAGASTNVVGAAATAVAITGGKGGYNTTSTAGAGAALTATAGAGGATSSTGTGGAGGASSLIAGAGGSSTAGTGGRGGSSYAKGGAGASSNGAGGFVVLQPGVGNGTGINGGVIERNSSVAATVAVGAACTVKDILSGYMELTGGGPGNVTTPAGADITAAIPGCQIGDMFVLKVNNTGAGTATITAGAGVTRKGAGTVANGKAGEWVFLRYADADWWVWAITSS